MQRLGSDDTEIKIKPALAGVSPPADPAQSSRHSNRQYPRTRNVTIAD
jgi:hypothetical protein